MSGSRWQGMETRQGDGTEALSQETESNGSATLKLWRNPLTLPADSGSAAAGKHKVCQDYMMEVSFPFTLPLSAETIR